MSGLLPSSRKKRKAVIFSNDPEDPTKHSRCAAHSYNQFIVCASVLGTTIDCGEEQAPQFLPPVKFMPNSK